MMTSSIESPRSKKFLECSVLPSLHQPLCLVFECTFATFTTIIMRRRTATARSRILRNLLSLMRKTNLSHKHTQKRELRCRRFLSHHTHTYTSPPFSVRITQRQEPPLHSTEHRLPCFDQDCKQRPELPHGQEPSASWGERKSSLESMAVQPC